MEELGEPSFSIPGPVCNTGAVVRKLSKGSGHIQINAGRTQIGMPLNGAHMRQLGRWIAANFPEPTFQSEFDKLEIGDKFRAGGDKALKVGKDIYVKAGTGTVHGASSTPPTYHFVKGW